MYTLKNKICNHYHEQNISITWSWWNKYIDLLEFGRKMHTTPPLPSPENHPTAFITQAAWLIAVHMYFSLEIILIWCLEWRLSSSTSYCNFLYGLSSSKSTRKHRHCPTFSSIYGLVFSLTFLQPGYLTDIIGSITIITWQYCEQNIWDKHSPNSNSIPHKVV